MTLYSPFNVWSCPTVSHILTIWYMIQVPVSVELTYLCRRHPQKRSNTPKAKSELQLCSEHGQSTRSTSLDSVQLILSLESAFTKVTNVQVAYLAWKWSRCTETRKLDVQRCSFHWHRLLCLYLSLTLWIRHGSCLDLEGIGRFIWMTFRS